MQHSNCLVCQPPTTSFSVSPIGTVETLARILRYPLPELQQIAATANQRYRIGSKKRKKDGSVRICYDAVGPLKTIQARIQCLILHKVHYPIYLQGSIRDRSSPRGQKANASRHVRKRILITQDIKQFFLSVRSNLIFEMWHGLFRFPPEVAEILTRLTTKDGCLPQGTKTSALLANLVFWDSEWIMVAELHGQGITYTRLIDDITCSSPVDLTEAAITNIISALRQLVHRKGLCLNAHKQTISHAGQRHVSTKLVVNAKTALPSELRSAIRAAVTNLRKTPEEARARPQFERDYSRVSGRVSYLKQHHPNEAKQLREELKEVRRDFLEGVARTAKKFGQTVGNQGPQATV